jgi:hypothetical protein
MATALEKFQKAMNNTSPFWVKTLEVTAKNGEVVLIKCEGFSFMSDAFKEDSCSEEPG